MNYTGVWEKEGICWYVSQLYLWVTGLCHERVLAKREGDSQKIFSKLIEDAGFSKVNETYCMFPPIQRIGNKLSIVVFNSSMLTRLDSIIGKCWPGI